MFPLPWQPNHNFAFWGLYPTPTFMKLTIWVFFYPVSCLRGLIDSVLEKLPLYNRWGQLEFIDTRRKKKRRMYEEKKREKNVRFFSYNNFLFWTLPFCAPFLQNCFIIIRYFQLTFQCLFTFTWMAFGGRAWVFPL